MSAIKKYSTYVASIALLAIFLIAASDPASAENEARSNALLRFFDHSQGAAPSAGIAGLAMDSTGSVYFAGGVGERHEQQGILRKFSRNGQLVWEDRRGERDGSYRQVVVDSEDQIYLSFENLYGQANARIHKKTPQGDEVWTTEIPPPANWPGLNISNGYASRIATGAHGIFVAAVFLGTYDAITEPHILVLPTVARLSHEGVLEWRTDFWPILDGENPWPTSSNDVWLERDSPPPRRWLAGAPLLGSLIRSVVPDGAGGVFLVGDKLQQYDGYYFHLDEAGRPKNGVISLVASLEDSGLSPIDAAAGFGLQPLWLLRGAAGAIYISGGGQSPDTASVLFSISELGQPLWFAEIPCQRVLVNGLETCGARALLYPLIAADGSLVLLEQEIRNDPDPNNRVGRHEINLVNYSSSGELLSLKTIAAPIGDRDVRPGGFLVNEKMFWVSGGLAKFETVFVDNDYLEVAAGGSTFLMRCPTAALRAEQGCPIPVE